VDAPPREYDLREVFNGLRSVVKNGVSWRDTPGDPLPAWAIHPQMQRWVAAGCFEAIVHDLRMILRLAEVRAPEPPADSPATGQRLGRSWPRRGGW